MTPLVVTLLERAEREADRIAIDGEPALTFGQLAGAIRRSAAHLAAAGVAAGDRVVIRGNNSADWVTAYFAVHACGAVAVPVDVDASPATLGYVLELARPALALAETASDGAAIRELAFSDLHGEAAAVRPGALPALGDVADILFTTGTTARPKGVVLTHANIAHAALNTATFLEQRETARELVAVPLSHSFGLNRARCMALCGSSLILDRNLRSPASLIGVLVQRRATGLSITPAGVAMLRRLTKDRLAQARDHLRFIELGSMAMSAEVRDWLLSLLPDTRICHHYGLTEASRAAFVVVGSPPSLAGSIGRASPNVRITVRDEHGAEVSAGAEGELCVEGGMVMQGYLDRPDLTAQVLVDGVLHTGDLGRIDSDGNIYLRGRKSELINVGGYKVTPAEVEQYLLQIDGISDAACIGIPDPSGVVGERVMAFVVGREVTLEEVIQALRGWGVETFKHPAAVKQIDAVPRSPSGKIMRHQLVT